MALTWSNIDHWSVRLSASTGTEAATDLNSTSGLNLARGTNDYSGGVGKYEVHIKPTSGAATLTAGGLLKGYALGPDGVWKYIDGGDYTIPTLAAGAGVAFAGVVANSAGRIAYIPSGCGVACTIDIIGTRIGS